MSEDSVCGAGIGLVWVEGELPHTRPFPALGEDGMRQPGPDSKRRPSPAGAGGQAASRTGSGGGFLAVK